jgi:hypothetical protein
MTESGGRRIKRSVNIDMTSVRFLTSQEQLQLKQANCWPLSQPQGAGAQQLQPAAQRRHQLPINGRHLTNLGTLRAYLDAYLHAHSGIRKDMTLMVRQLAPTRRPAAGDLLLHGDHRLGRLRRDPGRYISTTYLPLSSNSICVCINRQPVMTCMLEKRLIPLMTRWRQRGPY